jgi:hypothetical protein
MLKYLSKVAMDMLPSVAATIIGAYVVNHYIITRPGVNAPVAAAVSTIEPTAEAKTEPAKPVSKPSGKSVDVANLPEPGVKAKGVSERAMLEKTAAEKPASVDKPAEKPVADKAVADKPAEKPVVDKSADKSMETASIPVETRRHQPAPREKAMAKGVSSSVSAPVQPFAAPVPAPVVAPNTAPPAEAAIAPDEHRDANDLARAAIERLRGTGDGSPRAQEAARTPDAPRVVLAPPVAAAPPVRPLPPPIMVSTPGSETLDQSAASSQPRPPYAADDPRRPVPPADIPPAPPPAPLDLHADATDLGEPREHRTVAEDVLSAAKSVFHAVLPK